MLIVKPTPPSANTHTRTRKKQNSVAARRSSRLLAVGVTVTPQSEPSSTAKPWLWMNASNRCLSRGLTFFYGQVMFAAWQRSRCAAVQGETSDGWVGIWFLRAGCGGVGRTLSCVKPLRPWIQSVKVEQFCKCSLAQSLSIWAHSFIGIVGLIRNLSASFSLSPLGAA